MRTHSPGSSTRVHFDSPSLARSLVVTSFPTLLQKGAVLQHTVSLARGVAVTSFPHPVADLIPLILNCVRAQQTAAVVENQRQVQAMLQSRESMDG